YANGFANDRTSWMRESVAVQRVKKRERETQDELGYIEIAGVRCVRTAPTDQGAQDRATATTIDGTVMTVALDPPLSPGATIVLEIRFTTRFPRTIARMGFAGDHYDGMQWFPKLGALV